MADEKSQRKAIAEQFGRGLAAENKLTPDQARAFVRGMQVSWEVPPIHWSAQETEAQVDDVRRLLHAAAVLYEVEGSTSSVARDCYRRAAEILEWLSRSDDVLKIEVPIQLLASAAYQLAGLPAMATSLLSQNDTSNSGNRLYSNFLAADFDGTVAEALKFWAENDGLTKKDSAIEILLNDDEDGVEWYFTTELVRCIGLAAAALRAGNVQRVDRSLEKLIALEKMAVRTFNHDTALFIRLLNLVAMNYSESSIYSALRRLSALKPSQTSRLELFGRGQFSRGRGILWTSQKQGLDRLIAQPSFALCTPTGSGKTLVANLALIKELLLNDDDIKKPLALYLVPSRALAGEVEAKLTQELGPDFIVTGLYGGADWGVTDYWLQADQPTVLIATVEKADALMRYVGPLIVSRLRLLIVDEAHQVVTEDATRTRSEFADHSNRSLRLESFVSRLLARLPSLPCIALTAVAGGAADPVARWIERNAIAKPIGTNYRSTRQLIGVLEAKPKLSGRMAFDFMNGADLSVRGRAEPVYIPLRAREMPMLSAKVRDSVYHFNELHVLWNALHLVDAERRILISVAQQPERTMRWYKEALDLDEWSSVFRFSHPENNIERGYFEAAQAACIDYCGKDSFEFALLNRGIATNHGQMPQRLRRLMTQLIEHRICPITIATATLTEGVNLPFDIIFVTSLRRPRYDPLAEPGQRNSINPMSTSEFRNLAGRAGRPGATRSMEGVTLVALPVAPSTTAQSKIHSHWEQIGKMRADYDNMIKSLRSEGKEGHKVESPLALLINAIAKSARDLFGLSEIEFLEWLEDVALEEISSEAGQGGRNRYDILADSLDELDNVLLTAVEEVAMGLEDGIPLPELERFFKTLWSRSFSRVAALQEERMEQIFVQRGVGIIRNVYPDPLERQRLFQYGFSPHVGRRFERIAPRISQILTSAKSYGLQNSSEQLAYFVELVKLLESDRGFGLRGRDTVRDHELLADWKEPLSWWLNVPSAPKPSPENLRTWQRFVGENFEFRLGTAVGAVVGRMWSNGTDDPLSVPSLAKWRQTTGMPWFGFWAKELLRWGTLDPFVAFALAQGIAGTRSAAQQRRNEFEEWQNINGGITDAEDLIDPQNFIAWAASLQQPESPKKVKRRGLDIKLANGAGASPEYVALPIVKTDSVMWIDPSGYLLGTSRMVEVRNPSKDDFRISRSNGEWKVKRTYSNS